MTASFGNLILDKKKFLHSTETFEIRIPKFGQTHGKYANYRPVF